MSDYIYGTTPYKHQHQAFITFRDAEASALLCEMGTGKTKIAIDTAAYLYQGGKIGSAIVLAPKGVHRNWIDQEIPRHTPDWCSYVGAYWASSPRKAERRMMDKLFDPSIPGLRWAAGNYEMLITKNGRAWLDRIIRLLGPVLLILDESHRIKTPGSKRTKVAQVYAKRVAYRRILTGTPLTKSPLDFFAQFKFLDPAILGHQNFAAFRAEYAVLLDPWHPLVKHAEKRARFGRVQIIAEDDEGRKLYKNQAQLKRLVNAYSFFARKEDTLDIPAKVYAPTRYVELDGTQRRLYDAMLKDGVAGFNEDSLFSAIDTGDYAEAQNALVKLGRLQQITGGHVTTATGESRWLSDTRVKALLDTLEDVDGQAIIWARYRPEIEHIVGALKARYGDNAVVEYHGGVKDAERDLARTRFESGDAQWFVGTASSGGIGIDLIAASCVVYYSQSDNFDHRAQSEDRAHRIGQTKAVTYITFCAPGTVDENIAARQTEKARLLKEFMR